MFDTSVQSSSNPFDTAYNPSLMGFGGNSELSDNLTPDLMKNLRLCGASQEVINIESLALATNGSLPQLDTSLTIQSTEALTLDISNSIILSATSSIDPLTGQALAAQTGSNFPLSPVMEQALQLTYDTLTGLASDPDFSTQMNLAFGNSGNPDVASTIAQDFINRNFSELPSVEIFQSAAINGANGAFDSLNNTIYLSNEYINQNAANPEAITSVLLEEIGHYIDSQINISDAPGDEGAIFAKLAQGETLDEEELLALKAEDDTATIRLGGKVIQIEQSSTLEVAQNEDGRLETFAVGTDGEVWQKWQTAPNGYWSDWQQMGFKAAEIEVAQNEDGHLDAFAIGTDGEVWQKWQTAPNGYWSDWQQMGLKATEIEVAQNEDGRLEALAIDMDGDVWHKWQTAPNGYWGDWEQMGLKATELDVGQNQDGRLEAFAVGLDGEVWQRWQTEPNGYWSNWQQMGLKATDVEVAQHKDGRLETFVVGTDGEVWQKWQTAPNGYWSDWQQMGLKATELDVGQNQDGRLEIVAIATDGEVWQKWQTAPNGYWSDWQQMGLKATEIEVTQNQDGRLETFIVGTDGEVWQKWQTAPNGYWSNWEKMGLQAAVEEGLTEEELTNYYPELTSITEDQWDEYSGDNTRLGYVYFRGEVDETGLIPQEYRQSIKNIYIDLSTEVLGQEFPMTAGYMHDKSYYQGVKSKGSTGWWHSGIDFAASAGTTVKSVSNGTIAWINNWNAATNGYFIGVNDSNGKIWIYGHLQSPSNWRVGDTVESGEIIGSVGSQLGDADHLHLAVQTDRNKPADSQRTKARVDEATMSPLQAFWEWKNI